MIGEPSLAASVQAMTYDLVRDVDAGMYDKATPWKLEYAIATAEHMIIELEALKKKLELEQRKRASK